MKHTSLYPNNATEETGCDSLTIITNDEERVITGHGQGIIRVVPAWKWCL